MRKKSVEDDRDCQRYSPWDCKRIGIFKSDLRPRQPKGSEGNQNVADVSDALQESTFVDDQCQSHHPGDENRTQQDINHSYMSEVGTQSRRKLQIAGSETPQQPERQQQGERQTCSQERSLQSARAAQNCTGRDSHQKSGHGQPVRNSAIAQVGVSADQSKKNCAG